MKLQILSDIHLEFSNFVPPETDADVIVMAGDIGKSSNGVDWARQTWPDKEIVMVAGNHEHYGFDRLKTLDRLRKEASLMKMNFLENDEFILNNVRFLGATLWTDFKLFGYDQEWFAVQAGQRGLNDFRLITENGKPFTAKRSQELHEESVKWLKLKLSEPFNGKTVVVTHHVPSMLSVADRFKRDLLSASFASNLDDLFGRCDIWIHGHTHDCFDYVSEGTRVVCNPRGYITSRGAEYSKFNERLVIEI